MGELTKSGSPLFVCLSLLLLRILSIDEAGGPITIIPNNSTKFTCTVGAPFSQNFAGRSLLPGSFSYKFTNLSYLPPELSITQSGTLSGTCQRQGDFTFSLGVYAIGLVSATVNSTYYLSVLPNTSVNTTLPFGYVGVPYSAKMSLNQPVGKGNWITSNLPAWLSFNPANQIVSGTPPQVGNWPFYIAHNSTVGYTNSTFTLIVRPNILMINPQSIAVTFGKPGSFVLDARGGSYPYSYIFSSLPRWLISNQNTLEFDGNCDPGNYKVSLIVADRNSLANAFNISVTCILENSYNFATQTNAQNYQSSPPIQASTPVPTSNQFGNSQTLLRSGFLFSTANDIQSTTLLPTTPVPQAQTLRTQQIIPPSQSYIISSSLVAQPPLQAQNLGGPFQIGPAYPVPLYQNPVTLNSLARISNDTVIYDTSQPPRGLVFGGTCLPNSTLSAPYDGSGVVAVVNYNSNSIILATGQILVFQPCTRTVYNGREARFNIGNTVSFTAQRSSPSEMGQSSQITIPISYLLSITNYS